ncbi:hypothetical protein NUU61_008413 [Penicillium alfredii]|uniref:AB hydrolase-1 domain-containing protein n=1 Tax=Penicillium alfredii TaxID=1506179 RepID=A0A9W9JZI2_9EURO|nr:uncharacterized protein NUU61_008413 [Penicillium alfredii]KAJ5087106.1 hypothetical protein NUU61_008413 [Penicillium alfredii]
MASKEDVKFQTLDGFFLGGRLYPAAQRGPAIILTPGYNTIVENFPAGLEQEFQKANITALSYDPRSTGGSGGLPRNDIDPFKRVEDYSDALTYLSTLPIVDANAIVFWGVSLSAAIVLAAASVDRRVAAVISVAPVFDYKPMHALSPNQLKIKMMKDRMSQMLHGHPQYMLSIAASLAQVPFKAHFTSNHTPDRAWSHNSYETTMQSYYRMFLFEPVPEGVVHSISPIPLMFVTPELDQISPPERQSAVFKALPGPKRQIFAPGKEHLFVMHGPEMPSLVRSQIEFIWQAVRGHLKPTPRGPDPTWC